MGYLDTLEIKLRSGNPLPWAHALLVVYVPTDTLQGV